MQMQDDDRCNSSGSSHLISLACSIDSSSPLARPQLHRLASSSIDRASALVSFLTAQASTRELPPFSSALPSFPSHPHIPRSAMSKQEGVWNGETQQQQSQQQPQQQQQQVPPPYSQPAYNPQAQQQPQYIPSPYEGQPPQYVQQPGGYQQQPFQGQPQSLGGVQYAPSSGPPVYYPPQVTYAGGPPPQVSPYSQPVAMQPMGQQPQYYAQPQYIVQQVPQGPVRVQGGAACKKCGQVYPLPNGAGSWRCKNCSEFNNMGGDQCALM